MVAKYAMRMTLPKAQSKSNREKNRNRNLGFARRVRRIDDGDHSRLRVAHASRVLVSVSHRNNLCPDSVTPGDFVSTREVRDREDALTRRETHALPYGP